MNEERRPAASSRFLKLAQQFSDKEFRDSYVAALTRRFLARQMRKFRGDLSQIDFAERIDKQQTIVSRLENPNYSGWTLNTLFEIAGKLNVGVVVRFVDFPSFLKATEDFSESAMHPMPYDQQKVDDFAQAEALRELDEIKKLFERKPTPAPRRDEEHSQRLAALSEDDDRESAADYQKIQTELSEVPKLKRPDNSAAFQRQQPEQPSAGV